MSRSATLARSFAAAALASVTVTAGFAPSAYARLPVSVTVHRAASAPRHPARQLGSAQLPGFQLGAVTKDLAGFDHLVGHRASLRVLFLGWGNPLFPTGTIRQNAALGAQTVIEFGPTGLTMRQVGDGVGDAWLRGVVAAGIAAYGHPVTISFGPEMNGQWYSWGFKRTKPADYVRAWRHLHDMISGTAAGPYVTWLWQPSAIHFTTPSPKLWWPGSKYVDEIGLDGYYVVPWDTFHAIFAQTIRLVQSLTNRPILIGETAVGATTGHAAGDIRNMFRGIRAWHLHGLIWFDIAQHAGKYHQDWALRDHPRVLSEFITQLGWMSLADFRWI